MKMREISRTLDKKLVVNNNLDIILGAGIASQSISIDGLSQSIGTTQSAMFGGMSARCEQYKKDIDNEIPVLRMQFSSPRMVVL